MSNVHLFPAGAAHTPPAAPQEPATNVKRSSRRQKTRPETQQSLAVYAALVSAAGPRTVRQLIEMTRISSGSLYPILQKRVDEGLLVIGVGVGSVATYELTPKGYIHAREILTSLERPTQDWVKAEQRYAPRPARQAGKP